MIIGIGTDIVEIGRLHGWVERWGRQAGRRILTIDEFPAFLACADPARFLAKRFAVKEAFAKALGVGLRSPVCCTAMGIEHDSLGKPSLVLTSELAHFIQQRGVTRQHISISDERHYAFAMVVLEAD